MTDPIDQSSSPGGHKPPDNPGGMSIPSAISGGLSAIPPQSTGLTPENLGQIALMFSTMLSENNKKLSESILRQVQSANPFNARDTVEVKNATDSSVDFLTQKSSVPSNFNLSSLVNGNLTNNFFKDSNSDGNPTRTATTVGNSSEIKVESKETSGTHQNSSLSSQREISTRPSSTGGTPNKVPVDYQTPSLVAIPLSYGNVTPDAFLRWKDQVISALQAVPKFSGLCTMTPEESWAYFLEENKSKYAEDVLQKLYITCHREIWGFIRKCLDSGYSMQLEREFELSGENLPKRLGFTFSPPTPYQNAYAMMNKITSFHTQKSFVRNMELSNQLCYLRYTGNEDPRIFLQKFNEILNTGALLGDGWPVLDDRSKAMFLMGKLVGNQLQSVRSNLLLKDDSFPITAHDVEVELIRWWAQKELNKGSNNYGKNQSKSRSPHKDSHSSQEGVSANPAQPQNQGKQSNSKMGKQSKNHSSSVPKAQSTPQSDDQQEGESAHYDMCAIAESIEDFSGPAVNSASREYPDNYTPQRHEMLWDTGATVSITPLEDIIKDSWNTPSIRISTMGGPVTSKSVGNIRLNDQITLKNVHIVPSAKFSLFSLSKATENGCAVVFTGQGAMVIPPSKDFERDLDRWSMKAILHAKRKGRVWVSSLGKPSKANEEGFIRHRPSPPNSLRIPKKANASSSQNSSNSPLSAPQSSKKAAKPIKQNPPKTDSPKANPFLPLANAIDDAEDETLNREYEASDSEEERRF
jgi:hypothetical protein